MTMWFRREPGSHAALGETDPHSVLVGYSKPEWVRLPSVLGGEQARVLSQEEAPCPKCSSDHPVRTLHMDGGLAVAECVPCGFVWFQKAVGHE
jgi:hypothetical protein